MIDFKIAPITEEYIEQFREAVGSVARERKYLAFLDSPSLEMSQEFVKSNLKNNMPHFIAISNDKVVGWCDIVASDRPVLKHSGTLGIGVLSGFRGAGIGKALIQAAINKAKEIGLTRVELTVREHNTTAIELYKKIGFEIEGIHRNAVLIDDKYENQIFMALLLN